MKRKLPPNPKQGDTRTYTKFAWLPTFVHDDNECYEIWLEKYRITEKYQEVTVFTDSYHRRELRWTIAKCEPIFLARDQ